MVESRYTEVQKQSGGFIVYNMITNLPLAVSEYTYRNVQPDAMVFATRSEAEIVAKQIHDIYVGLEA